MRSVPFVTATTLTAGSRRITLEQQQQQQKHQKHMCQ